MRKVLVVDTEFTNFTSIESLATDAKLISVAVLDPVSGEYFYAEVDGWEESDCSEFVVEHVLPQLNDFPVSIEEAAHGLKQFLAQYDDFVFASDAVECDHVMLCQLFGGSWPKGCSDLMSSMVDLYEESDSIIFGQSGDPFPHHALLDAQILANASLDKIGGGQ